MIWRDDDISVTTKLPDLLAVDDLFQEYGAVHTIAVIAKGLETRRDLIAAIKDRKMDVQLHGWIHEDLTKDDEALWGLPDAVMLLDRLFGVRPTTLYPPWNRSDGSVASAAEVLGLTLSTEKSSLEHYLKYGEAINDVVNFHYWSPHERHLLGIALSAWRTDENHRLRTTNGTV